MGAGNPHELTDAARAVLEPLPPRPGRGHPWRDHRMVINGILWVLATGVPWRDVPERYGPWQTLYDRVARWTRDGTWDRLLAALLAEMHPPGAHRLGPLVRGRHLQPGAQGGCRLATRAEKLATPFAAMVTIALVARCPRATCQTLPSTQGSIWRRHGRMAHVLLAEGQGARWHEAVPGAQGREDGQGRGRNFPMRQSWIQTLVLMPAALLGLLLGGCGGGGYGEGDAAPGTGLGVGPGSGILFVRAEIGPVGECPTCRVPGSEEIWVMNPDGSGQTRLTNDRRRDSDPQWSPDGTKILFVRQAVPGVGDYPENDPDVWVMNADGSGKTNLTRHEAEDLQPRWSPDGRQIVFTSERDGNADIFLMNADGSNVRNLTNHPAGDTEPAFSPDGTKIAFRSGRVAGTVKIFVMNLDGSGVTNVSGDCCEPPEGGGSHFGPFWSPDGTRLVFGAGRFGLADEEPLLWVVNADGSGRRLLTTEVNDARFTRDNSQILYTSTGGLELLNLDGSGHRFLVVDLPSFVVSAPLVLRPDGRRVAVAGEVFDEASGSNAHGIFIVDLDSATPTSVPGEVQVEVTRVTDDPGDVPADWR
jgi:transposase